jgi:hypothetical protein
MRWIKQILLRLVALSIATTGIVAALLMVIWALILLEESKEKAFYATHPFLHAMLGRPEPSRTKLLLDRVPLGTKRLDAIAIMASEKINCERPAALLQRDMLVCSAKDRPCGVPRWHIEFSFDERDEVRTGRAIALKATCEA